MVHPVVDQCPLQRLGDVLLADHVGKGVGTVAAIQGQRSLGTAHGGRVGLGFAGGFERLDDRVGGKFFSVERNGWLSGRDVRLVEHAEQIGAVLLERLRLVEEGGLVDQVVVALVVHG